MAMKNVVGVVLGGGKGTRLYPLTRHRSKPAVPLFGKYRLIDVPLSNCINSGINRMYVLTQFNSVSLHRHIRTTYWFDPFDKGFVEILAAQQTLEGEQWYEGTADAVRKNMRYLDQPEIEYVLILSGDQLYRMDFNDMLRTHREHNADITIAGLPITREAARAFGIMRLDDSGRVRGFVEKPQTDEQLASVRMDPAWMEHRGVSAAGRDCIASMGIYLFRRDVLLDILRRTDYQDFGKEVFPSAIDTHHVQLHLFDGYWEDIGTIRSFYEANLNAAGPSPPFSFVHKDAPIYSRPRYLPPTRMENASVVNSLIADGCTIGKNAVIENSVIGLRCQIGEGAIVRNAVVMGADYYEQEQPQRGPVESSSDAPPLGIGEGSVIDGVIVDKNARIGARTQIVAPSDSVAYREVGEVVIRDGIVVLPKNFVAPDEWRLEQDGE